MVLALIFCAALLPAGAFAADHIRVNAPQAYTVVTGGLAGGSDGIDLTTIFSDNEGHEMTFAETTPAGNSNPSAHIKNGHYYFSSSAAGTYHPVITASCSEGSASCTLTITSTPASQGLASQYGYNQTPASSVTVYVTFSSDGVPILGNDTAGTPIVRLPVTVPYFDLEAQELQDYYRYETDGDGSYIGTEVIERPTLMHLFLYMIGVYYLGLTPEQVTSGAVLIDCHAGTDLPVENMLGNTAYTSTLDALYLTGSATSSYMQNFWGHDENLMYYRNHCYPLQRAGWGSTSDYILLSDGDVIDLAMFSNWDFYHYGGFVCFGNGISKSPVNDFTVVAGDTLTVQTLQMGTQEVVNGGEDSFNVNTGVSAAVYTEDWELVGNMSELESLDGGFTYVFEKPGTYYILAMDDNAETNDACFAPATATVTVTPQTSFTRGDVNADGSVTAMDVIALRKYLIQARTLDEAGKAAADVNADGSVTAMDVIRLRKYLIHTAEIN